MGYRSWTVWAGSEFMGRVVATSERGALEKWCRRAKHGSPEDFCHRFAYLPDEFRAVQS